MRAAFALLASVAVAATAPPAAAQGKSRVDTVLEAAKAARKEAEQASSRGNHLRAGELEEKSADDQREKLLPLAKNDTKLGVLVLVAAAEADIRAADYFAKAGSFARAASALERALDIHTKLKDASPHASALPGWRTKIRDWRSRAGSSSAKSSSSTSSSSSRPSSSSAPTSETPLQAVDRAIKMNDAGRTSEALVVLDAALPKLDATSAGADAALVARANLVAARIYDDALLPSKAEVRLKRAVSVVEASGGAKDKALVEPLTQLASHYVNRDEEERAAPHYMRAYDIAMASAPDRVPECIIGLARVVNARKDHKEAIALMIKARALLAQNMNGQQAALTYMFSSMSLANMYESIDDFPEAEKLLEEVRVIFEPMYRSAPDKLGLLWASYSSAVGWHWRKRGDFAKAERAAKEAFDIISKVYPKESLTTANAECNLGEVYWASGDLERSLDPIGHCFDLREKSIARILASGSEEQKRAYVQGFVVAYEKTMTAQVRAGNRSPRLNRLAMNQVLRTKGRILDAVTGESLGIRRNADAATRTLLDRLATVRTTLAGLATSGRDSARITQLEEESRNLEAQLSEKSAGFKLATREVSISTVRAAIPQGAALVEIVAFRPLDPLYRTMSDQEEQRYIAYVLHGDGSPEPVAIDLGPSAPIDRMAAELRAVLSDPNADPLAPAAKLYEQVMAPLEPHLRGKTHLVVSPDGALNTIPFAAMRKNDAYLVSSYTFTYVTSGRDLLRWGSSQGQNKGLVVMANPDFAMNGASATSGSPFARVKFPPLPGTESEAVAIKSLFSRAVVKSGRDATESELKGLKRPRVLHLATHGFFLDDTPAAARTRGLELDEGVKENVRQADSPLLRSGLALAGAASLKGTDPGKPRAAAAAEEDGILTALEAASLDLSGTKLVVLSACQTAQGEARNGEGVYGLRRALSMAGAETLVMSLWSVDDEATSYLMQGYYKRLKASRGRSEALRDVQLEMARSKSVHHPYYWAAFIPSGDPGSMSLADEAYSPSGGSTSSSRPARDEASSSRYEPPPRLADSTHADIGFHYMSTTNLRDQADRVGGLVSLSFDVPVFSRFIGGHTFGIHDGILTGIYAGMRTSSGTEYASGESEGIFGLGGRLGYELALGVRGSGFGFYVGGQALYNTFVLGDVRTYGLTAPLIGILNVPLGEIPVGLRGSYGKWLVDQETVGGSISFGFKSVDLRFGIEQLKMPASVSLDGADDRASAGRQVSTIGTLALGGRL